MKEAIKEKLQEELNKDISSETEVIYILSRARKILEIDKKLKQHQVLAFYCNWALHAEIGDAEAIRPLIDRLIKNEDEATVEFFLFEPFHKAFKKFIAEYNFSTSIYKDKNVHKFNWFLSRIYSDTPLIVKIKKTKITLIDNTAPGSTGYSRALRVAVEDVT